MHGRFVGDYLALSDDTDPFYAERPGLQQLGHWFNTLFTAYGYRRRWEQDGKPCYLRGMHYFLRSTSDNRHAPRGPRRLRD